MESVNLLSVLLAALLFVLIGWGWYSPPLFGGTCQLTEEQKNDKTGCMRGMIGSFIAGLVIAYVLSMFMTWLHIVTLIDGAVLGFFIWLGFLVTTHLSSVLWGGRPLKEYIVHMGYLLVAFLVMGGLLGIWT